VKRLLLICVVAACLGGILFGCGKKATKSADAPKGAEDVEKKMDAKVLEDEGG